jgi:hypothetical protein
MRVGRDTRHAATHKTSGKQISNDERVFIEYSPRHNNVEGRWPAGFPDGRRRCQGSLSASSFPNRASAVPVQPRIERKPRFNH